MGKKRRNKGKLQSAAKAGSGSGRPSTTSSAPRECATEAEVPAIGGEVEWPSDTEDQRKLLTAIKLKFLAPFLFGQKTLSLEAELYAVEASLLPRDERVWPPFFEESQWRTAVMVCEVVLTSFDACRANQHFRDCFLKGKTTVLQDSSMVAKLLKMHSKVMTQYSVAEVEEVYKVLRLQVASMSEVGVVSPTHLFLEGLEEKEQLVLPIKDRGNSNFKECRYRAAIGDYTRAIRISPYSAVLYCNRALCFLRNGDIWSACVDSFRASILKPEWQKPYYRCSEAWMLLGNLAMAQSVNALGQEMCSLTSDLCRQYKEILVAIENSKKVGGQAPPTASVGERTREPKASPKAPKKEGGQRERGERSTNSIHLPAKVNGGADGVDLDDVAMTTKLCATGEEGSDVDLSASLNHNGTTTAGQSGTKRDQEVLKREPIEDKNEWEFRHTSTARKVLREQSVELQHMRTMFNMEHIPSSSESESSDEDDFPSAGGGVASTESVLESQEEREEKEMEDFRQREREREKVRAERECMRTAEKRKLALTLPNPDPFTQFEKLHVPTVDVSVSTAQLFDMIRGVPSRQLVESQYTAHSEAWQSLEPLPPLRPPIRPEPPASTFNATFDEVWCPLLAGVLETADIIPPRIHYVGNMVTKYIPHYPPHSHRYEL